MIKSRAVFASWITGRGPNGRSAEQIRQARTSRNIRVSDIQRALCKNLQLCVVGYLQEHFCTATAFTRRPILHIDPSTGFSRCAELRHLGLSLRPSSQKYVF